MCPNCSAHEDHVVVSGVAFCRKCGPQVWGPNGRGTRRIRQQEQEKATASVATVQARRKR